MLIDHRVEGYLPVLKNVESTNNDKHGGKGNTRESRRITPKDIASRMVTIRPMREKRLPLPIKGFNGHHRHILEASFSRGALLATEEGAQQHEALDGERPHIALRGLHGDVVGDVSPRVVAAEVHPG